MNLTLPPGLASTAAAGGGSGGAGASFGSAPPASAEADAAAAAAKYLVSPTVTGMVANPEAASGVPREMLQGSNIVSLEKASETGEFVDYEDLFYRRRLEPPFKPFTVGADGAQEDVLYRWRNGIMEVVRTPSGRRSSVGAAGSASARSGGGAAAGGAGAGSSSASDADATPSREWLEESCMEESSAAAAAADAPTLFPVPSWAEYKADYDELW